MLDQVSLAVNPTDETVRSQVIPFAPLFSSSRHSCNQVGIAEYHLPACESPECAFAQHTISLYTGESTVIERVIEGRIERDRFVQGDVICLNPAGLSRIMRSLGETQFIHLYLNPAFLAQVVFECTDADSIELIPQFKLHDPLIYHLGLAIKCEIVSNGASDRLYLESSANMLAAHLLRHYSVHQASLEINNGGLPKSQLRQITEYINNHLEQELTIATLANLVHRSPYYFIKLFKQSMGLTPYCYIIQQRLKRAKQLLSQTNLTILEIALHSGFSNPSRFSTVFRQHINVSPKMYREQTR